MKNLMRYLLLVVVLAALILKGSAQARQITDMAGRKVEVPDVIRKVYGVSPPATCMLYAVDQSLIAGLNYVPRTHELDYMTAETKQLPVIGGWFGQGQIPNLETLIHVDPDIILMWESKGSASVEKIEQTLKPLGFPVVRIRAETLGDYPRAFAFLGELLDRKERTDKMVEYANETLDILASVQAKLTEEERIPVYYAQGTDGLITDCSSSHHAELIPLCCGKNVHECEAKDAFGMEKISVEQVLYYNPEMILAREDAFYDTVYTDLRWQNVRAVQERRVVQIPRYPFDWFDRPPSFMRLMGARWLTNELHPDRYSVDIVEETQAFYRLFLKKSLNRKQAEEILFQ